jgi:flagellar basal body-associated protein FliL
VEPDSIIDRILNWMAYIAVVVLVLTIVVVGLYVIFVKEDEPVQNTIWPHCNYDAQVGAWVTSQGTFAGGAVVREMTELEYAQYCDGE